jgi:flagellar biosynthetic protein FliQ
MTAETVTRVVEEALMVCLIISAPAVLAAMAIGVLVSVVQTATQVQEQSLATIPKLIAVAVVLIACGLWMLQTVASFAVQIFALLRSVH